MRKILKIKDMQATVRALALVAGALALTSCGVFGGKGDKNKTPVLGNRVAILGTEAVIEADAALAGVQVVIPDATLNDEWAQPGGNASKSLGHLALGGSPARVWTASVQGSSSGTRLASAPVVLNGRLYVIDTAARVRAFDAASGASIWTANIESEGNRASQFGGGVSGFGDRIYATNGVGDVVALNAADGSQVWKKRPGGPLRGAPTLSNGNVYVMSQDNQMFALSQADGATQWTESGTLELTAVFGVAAPAAGQGTVIAGYSSGEITAYRYENGRNLWGDALSRTSIATSVATLTDIDADPVIDRGRVFAIGQGGRMASYELVSGQRLWEISIAGISTPWVAGEWIYVVTNDAKLLCIARATGKIRWISQLQRWRDVKDKKGPIRWTGPVLAGGRLILVSTRGIMTYVDPVTGGVQAEQDLGNSMTLSPVVANNMLYVLDNNGRLTAFR